TAGSPSASATWATPPRSASRTSAWTPRSSGHSTAGAGTGRSSGSRVSCTAAGGLDLAPARAVLVREADGGAPGLDGVAGVGAVAAEVGSVVRVGDVGEPRGIGVDAEVVEELAAARAADAPLADLAVVDGDELLRAPPAGRGPG